MSDYTPTTEEVRAVYNSDEFGNPAGLNDSCPEFDRWLAEVKADAWEEGQLALLEYMGVPLYSFKGDEIINPKQPKNPYRQVENSE